MDWFKLGRNPCREESGSVSNCFSQCLAASFGWWLIKPVDPLDLWVAELQGRVMEREISCSSREDLLRPTKKQRPDVPTWMICDLKAIFKGYVGVSLSSLRTCSFFADRPYQIPVPPKHFKSYGAVLKYMSGKHQMFFFQHPSELDLHQECYGAVRSWRSRSRRVWTTWDCLLKKTSAAANDLGGAWDGRCLENWLGGASNICLHWLITELLVTTENTHVLPAGALTDPFEKSQNEMSSLHTLQLDKYPNTLDLLPPLNWSIFPGIFLVLRWNLRKLPLSRPVKGGLRTRCW